VPKNVAIRHSIEQHSLAQILIDLNYSNSRARRSIQLNRMFRIKKCRLRLENLTMMVVCLFTFRVRFDESETEEIRSSYFEIYLQVL
jgi:hypothetical protein